MGKNNADLVSKTFTRPEQWEYDGGSVVFDPSRKDARYFVADGKDWVIYDNLCFGVSVMDPASIGYAPNKNYMDVLCQEGHEITREEFAKMYPKLGL
ncbi:hypothetical protein AGMMS50268_38460 [Spirochaetia bacterium]|nr:hypothetical protein AGMMS50268_38460 [Spirochaetia bacterium]